MTHAGDEEKLADPLFRNEMAHKICEGIVDYLKYMKQYVHNE
jgi:N-acetylmuramoyl-L-alanine amidase